MAHIFYEKNEIDIPKNAHINHNDARVYTMELQSNGKYKRTVIGKATSEKKMYPNNNFRFIYPNLWEQYYGKEDLKEHELSLGMYAFALASSYKNNLYPTLLKAYSPLFANAILDYALFSLESRCDSTSLFKDKMYNHILFSKDRNDDNWYSKLFNKEMHDNNNHLFKLEWIKECLSNNTNLHVWLSIDGSNNDCVISNTKMAQTGKSKTKNSNTIISYIWAVEATTGKPITYFVNNGSMHDSKSFQEIITLLGNQNIVIDGVIIDRGFCSKAIIDTCNKLNLTYVLMLTENTYGYEKLRRENSNTIRWNVNHIVDENGIFGITKTEKVFKDSNEDSYISLFFDGLNGSTRSVAFIKNVMKEYQKAIKDVKNNIEPSINENYKEFISISRDENNAIRIDYNYQAWQDKLNEKGFSAIASNKSYTPEEINKIYNLRDASEKQFAILKSQLGFDVTRVHSDNGIKNKLFVAFIASILRYEFMYACKSLNLDTNKMIAELERIKLMLMIDNRYVAIQNYSDRQLELFSKFNITSTDLVELSNEINSRFSEVIQSQIRTLPIKEKPIIKRGRKKKIKEEIEPKEKRKAGRPKGSKNKKTIEREMKEALNPPKEKRKAGRPKGSKNKKTIEREMKEALNPPKEKRKAGRPKGGKNKKKSIIKNSE